MISPIPSAGSPPPPPMPPAKKGLSTGCIVAIVVGVVLVILGILGLAVIGPIAGSMVIKKARMLEAKQQMASIVIAVKNYQMEYLRLPFVGAEAPTADSGEIDTTDAEGIALLEMVAGKNLRGLDFWTPPAPKAGARSVWTPHGGLVDPWGKLGYMVLLDYDGDGKIDDPEGVSGTIPAPVLIYSAGPDGDFLTWADNVCSWRN